jgi:Ca2+-binding RTX toxin-like protein
MPVSSPSFATDQGGSIVAADGCVAETAQSVRCRYDTGASSYVGLDARIRVGDANDSARLVLEPSPSFYPSADLRGGPGDDRLELVTVRSRAVSSQYLRGGPGDDLLIGGGADDSLYGGGGVDELHGEGGFNHLYDGDKKGSIDGDVLDGGGQGFLSYRSRTRRVRVDLRDPRPDGQRGERDRVTGVISVTGGRGRDVLAGTAGRNQIEGGGGSDRIFGRGGADFLFVEDGGVAVGGPGRDIIDAEGEVRAGCGGGRDVVRWIVDTALRRGPWLSPGCERISASGSEYVVTFPPHPIAVAGDGRLVFRVPCTPGPSCAQRLTITRPHPPFTELATRRFRTREAGRRIEIAVPPQVVDAARRRPVRLRVRLDGGIVFNRNFEASLVWRFDLDLR